MIKTCENKYQYQRNVKKIFCKTHSVWWAKSKDIHVYIIYNIKSTVLVANLLNQLTSNELNILPWNIYIIHSKITTYNYVFSYCDSYQNVTKLVLFIQTFYNGFLCPHFKFKEYRDLPLWKSGGIYGHISSCCLIQAMWSLF